MRRFQTRSASQRQKKIKNDLQADVSTSHKKKWTEEEQKKLLFCLKVYGHKNLDRMQQELPHKNKEDIRKFLILMHTQVRKRKQDHNKLRYWLSRSISETEKNAIVKHKNSIQIAQIIKFLSVDGLLENHPLPQRCEGIDFAAAYQCLYHCLMGYPLQPVNEATANFICESLASLTLRKNENIINDLTIFLKKKYGVEQSNLIQDKFSNLENCNTSSRQMKSYNKKPLIVYQKKRPTENMLNQSNLTPLKIVVEESNTLSSSLLKPFSVSIACSGETNIVNVPVKPQIPKTKLDEAATSLNQNIGFNPLQIPESFVRKCSTVTS